MTMHPIPVPVEDVRVDESRPWLDVDNDLIPENPSLQVNEFLHMLYLICSVIDVFVFVVDGGRLVDGFSVVIGVVGQSKTKKEFPSQLSHHDPPTRPSRKRTWYRQWNDDGYTIVPI